MIARLLRGFLVVAALALLLALGTWQLERKAWKEGLIAMLSARLTAAPADLPPREDWAKLDPANDEYRRVRLLGEFTSDGSALVYTTGSAFRSDVAGVGYWVMAPARLAGGSVVVVNRGFVPEGRQDIARSPPPAGLADMVGVMRWPEPRGTFAAKDDPAGNVWFTRDHLAIARDKHWGNVAPFFIELESPQPPGGLPRAGPLTVKLRNEHLSYAITWYGLAAALFVIVLLAMRRRRV